MAQKTTADGGGSNGNNGVSITDGELAYHRPRYHGLIDEFSGKIEAREVNQYTTVETEHQSFESTVSSNDERDGAFALWVCGDGSYRVADLHSPEANVGTDSNTVDARHLWNGGWDWKIADGIRNKTVGSRSDTHRSATTRRTKIEREAVDQAHGNGERLFVVEYEARKGASAGSRGNESRSWDKLTTARVSELVLASE